jgi:hypothetical protein
MDETGSTYCPIADFNIRSVELLDFITRDFKKKFNGSNNNKIVIQTTCITRNSSLVTVYINRYSISFRNDI